MCNVRKHGDVKSWEDVQDLVTSVVIRQCCLFDYKILHKQIKAEMVGSSYDISEDDLKLKIKNTLLVLIKNQTVLYNKGKYKMTLVS